MDDTSTAARSSTPAADAEPPRFMTVRQVASYLQINEKKIYALVNAGEIPASKATGKWLFPRDLVDQWLLESSHERPAGRSHADRRQRRPAGLSRHHARRERNPGARPDQLHRDRHATRPVAAGQATRRHLRHPLGSGRGKPPASSGAAASSTRRINDWVLVRACLREQGIILANGLGGSDPAETVLPRDALGHAAGGRRLEPLPARGHHAPRTRPGGAPRDIARVFGARRSLGTIAMGYADVGIGVRAAATEFGLDFMPIGWEAFDFAMHRGMFFRTLFQKLLDYLRSTECLRLVAEIRWLRFRPDRDPGLADL
jgi:putative molybdopterin biosynthesis protein